MPSTAMFYPVKTAAEICGCSVARMDRIAERLNFPMISTDQRQPCGVMARLVPVEMVDKLRFLINEIEDAVVAGAKRRGVFHG